ncbi:MAG: histidine--tRNA ligase [Flavobacteriaceae bacterium]|nr:histidine--tRNA ligase [Flavobacteriaceae bacterium]|tara:strand:+ start:7918 stop:9303 length:1386 start_codon:yes stop_codon:yes gene_type:complete
MSLKPSIPKGTRDFSAKELAKRNYLKIILKNAFESFAFEPLETPSFEKTSTLTGKYGEEGDRLIFKILNSGEKLKKADLKSLKNNNLKKFSNSLSEKALRYDLTVPFARYVSSHQNDLIFPYRRYQIQNVWRADRPQYGRFQEFCQCDADIVGDKSLWQEVEMISLCDRVFNDLKLTGATIKINHRNIIEGICKLMGEEANLIDFTIAVDKYHKVGLKGVEKELIDKGFSEKAINKIKPIIGLKGSALGVLKKIESIFNENGIEIKGVDDLRFIFNIIDKNNLKSTKLSLDLTLARGLNYYTGMIIEVLPPDSFKIGSIGGGGRYDDLTSSFGMKKTSGIGFSFGFDRIFLVLDELNLFPENISKNSKILFLNFNSKCTEIAYKCLDKLRSKNIVSELYPSQVKLSKQLSYANKKKIPFVVIIGDEEIEKNQFVLKDMISGNQISKPIANLFKILVDISHF